MEDLTEAKVHEIPDCDFCTEYGKSTPAVYDAKTVFGPWAYMCDPHYQLHAYYKTLGTGKGQKLILAKDTE